MTRERLVSRREAERVKELFGECRLCSAIQCLRKRRREILSYYISRAVFVSVKFNNKPLINELLGEKKRVSMITFKESRAKTFPEDIYIPVKVSISTVWREFLKNEFLKG